jgi:hypothetical protein
MKNRERERERKTIRKVKWVTQKQKKTILFLKLGVFFYEKIQKLNFTINMYDSIIYYKIHTVYLKEKNIK